MSIDDMDITLSLDGFFQYDDRHKELQEKTKQRSDETVTTAASSFVSSLGDKSILSEYTSSIISIGSSSDVILENVSFIDDSSHCIRSSKISKSDSGKRARVPSDFTKEESKFQFLDLDFHKLIGEGEFGQVWLSSINNTITKRNATTDLLAVKVLSKHQLVVQGKDCVNHLLHEVEILQEIKCNNKGSQKIIHPCLAKMIDIRYDENFVYIVQKLYSGGELFHRMFGENNHISSTGVSFYAACIIDALHFLHKRGIIYRDIKPENIVCRHDNGYPVLIDFGYARHIKPRAKNAKSSCVTSEKQQNDKNNRNSSKWIKNGSSW